MIELTPGTGTALLPAPLVAPLPASPPADGAGTAGTSGFPGVFALAFPTPSPEPSSEPAHTKDMMPTPSQDQRPDLLLDVPFLQAPSLAASQLTRLAVLADWEVRDWETRDWEMLPPPVQPVPSVHLSPSEAMPPAAPVPDRLMVSAAIPETPYQGDDVIEHHSPDTGRSGTALQVSLGAGQAAAAPARAGLVPQMQSTLPMFAMALPDAPLQAAPLSAPAPLHTALRAAETKGPVAKSAALPVPALPILAPQATQRSAAPTAPPQTVLSAGTMTPQSALPMAVAAPTAETLGHIGQFASGEAMLGAPAAPDPALLNEPMLAQMSSASPSSLPVAVLPVVPAPLPVPALQPAVPDHRTFEGPAPAPVDDGLGAALSPVSPRLALSLDGPRGPVSLSLSGGAAALQVELALPPETVSVARARGDELSASLADQGVRLSSLSLSSGEANGRERPADVSSGTQSQTDSRADSQGHNAGQPPQARSPMTSPLRLAALENASTTPRAKDRFA